MRYFTRLRSLLVLGGLLLMAATLDADTLILRDGRRVQGQLIAFRDGLIEFQEAFGGGRTVRLSRDEVTGIEFDRYERNQPAYPQTPQPQQVGRPRGLREKQMMAAANVQWSDTGIDVS